MTKGNSLNNVNTAISLLTEKSSMDSVKINNLATLLENTLTESTVIAGNGITITKNSDGNYLFEAVGGGGGGGGDGGGVGTINDLTDCLVEDNSIYIGNDPSSTTNAAQYNVAIGKTALDSITGGDGNVAIGYDALTSNTDGLGNVAIGRDALKSNTDGYENIALGYQSLMNNQTGKFNTAIGAQTLSTPTNKDSNTAIGFYSLALNTSGYENTAVGAWSLESNTQGRNNTAIGRSAGDTAESGHNNVFIGALSRPSANDRSNEIVIGYNAVGHGAHVVVIGNTDCTAWHPADGADGADGVDLGSTIYKFKDLYINGVAHLGKIAFGSHDMTLPSQDGTPGQVLTTNGSNELTWAAPSSKSKVYGYMKLNGNQPISGGIAYWTNLGATNTYPTWETVLEADSPNNIRATNSGALVKLPREGVYKVVCSFRAMWHHCDYFCRCDSRDSSTDDWIPQKSHAFQDNSAPYDGVLNYQDEFSFIIKTENSTTELTMWVMLTQQDALTKVLGDDGWNSDPRIYNHGQRNPTSIYVHNID